MRHAPDIEAGGRGRSPSLRRSVIWATVLASLVALPALSARPWADERFILYWPEKLAGAHPWRLASKAVAEIPAYLDTGNFRPVSRFGFYVEHWAVVRTSVASGIPPNVTMGVVKILAIALLATALVLTLNQYRKAAGLAAGSSAWRWTVGTAVVFFASSLVLLNPARHPLTLFPGLYLGATALALFVPLLLGREWLAEGVRASTRRRVLVLVAWVGVGAVVASSIELAYMAVPLAAMHLVLMSRAGTPSLAAAVRGVRASAAFRSFLAMSFGFLSVFIPTRAAITILCADLPCYRATEPAVGLDFITVLPMRVAAGFFPTAVAADSSTLQRAFSVSLEYVAVSLSLAAVALTLLLRAALVRDGESEAPARNFLGPVAGYMAAVVLFASALGALSSAVQDDGFVLNPWRETGFVWWGWCGLLAAAAAWALSRWDTRRWIGVGAAVIVATTIVPSTIVNYRNMERVRLQPDSVLHIEAGTLLVNFDRSEAGNANRCTVIDALSEGREGSEARKAGLISDFLDSAARNHWGRLYCDRSDARG